MTPERVGVGVLLLLFWASSGCRIEEAENVELENAASGPDLEARVRSMLDSSSAGWNRGDLDAFMAAYRESEQTTYVGASGLHRGHESIRQRYAPRFGSGAERDSLRFEDLQVREVADGVAVGVARWILHRDREITGSGPFTMVLERTGDGWRIVHDHSSSEAGSGGEPDDDARQPG